MEMLIKRKFIKSIALFGLFCITLGFNSCKDDDVDEINSSYESIMVGDYIESNPKYYSEFTKLVKEAGMFNLLNAYGVYTCFIPTNEALLEYYEENGLSYDQLTDLEKKIIVQNHIISGKLNTDPIKTINFPIGTITSPNMNNDFIRVSTKRILNADGDSVSAFLLNEVSYVVIYDETVHNGVVHTIDKALKKPDSEIEEALDKLTDYSLFTNAMKATGLIDSLYLIGNTDYDQAILEKYPTKKIKDEKPSGSGSMMNIPDFCKYGYTIFMEKDEVFANANINTLDDLIKYAENIYYDIFPLKGSTEEQAAIKADYTDRNNALNRFISYHIMDRMMDSNDFIPVEFVDAIVEGTTIREYYEMMMPNSLIEIQTGNIINKSMYSATGDPNDIKISGKSVGSLQQVMFLDINNILTYKDAEANVFNKRLRMDITSMIGEFSSSKLRTAYPQYIVPKEFFGPNSKVSFSDETQFQHIASKGYYNMYSDELLFVNKYDFTIQSPPIPAGRWEVRISYTANRLRGVAQLFVNEKPCGIPLDLRILANDPRIGWIADSETDDQGLENDKMMRNRGYMKGPNSIKQVSGGTLLRNFAQSVRRIVTTVDIDKAQPITLRIKSVMDDTSMEFMIDYMEFVPSSYLDKEGKD